MYSVPEIMTLPLIIHWPELFSGPSQAKGVKKYSSTKCLEHERNENTGQTALLTTI